MDGTAINAIAHLATAAERAKVLDTHTPAALVEGKIVSLEGLQENRSRYRGAFRTSRLTEFAAYIAAAAVTNTLRTYVDPDRMAATTYLNEGTESTPGHCDWSATLTATKTAPFVALLQANGKAMSQREIVSWIEDWAPNLTAAGTQGPEERQKNLAAAVLAIRNMKIEAKSESGSSVTDIGARTSALSEIEAKSKSGALPEGFTMTFAPYLGLKARTFELRLSAAPGRDDKPELKLRVIGLEQAVEDIAEEFAQVIRDEVIESSTVHVGTFAP